MAFPVMCGTTCTMICLILAASCLPHFAECNEDRSRLFTKILLEYQAQTAPNQDSDPVRVDVALSIQHVGQVNEADGTVRVSFGLYQNWTDEATAWSKDEYNISSIFIPRHVLWVPDTVLHKGVLMTEQTSSTDVIIFASGQVAEVDIMDVSLPCVTRKSNPREESSDGSNEELRGKTTRVCTLILGCSIKSHATVTYGARSPDITGLGSLVDDWQLEGVYSHETMQSRPSPHDPIAVAVFDFVLVKNATLTDIPIQLVAPSIMTALAALGVFFLPPMAGERILMVGVAFLGQLILAGFSVLAQIQSKEPGTLYNFMLFSTIYNFLIIVAVLSSFFVFPLLKRYKKAEDSPEEDGVQLLTVTEKKFVSAIPDAIMFIIFIILYIVGMVTLFS